MSEDWFGITCRVCGLEYVHVMAVEKLEGNDNYEARPDMVRGDVVRVQFECEDGHEFYLCFGFHKGLTRFWVEDDSDGKI